MNRLHNPNKYSQAMRANVKPFEIPMQLIEADIPLIEPIWGMVSRKTLQTPNLGDPTFTLTDQLASFAGEVFLKAQLGPHEFYAFITSLEWIPSFLKVFEDFTTIPDNAEIVALALEAQFSDALDTIEEIAEQNITFVSLSTTPPDEDLEVLPGARFNVTHSKWSPFQISIVPTTYAANAAFTDLLTKLNQSAAPNIERISNVTLQGALVAEVAEMPASQLHDLKPGAGFLIDANWMNHSFLTLMVENEVLATVKSTAEGFMIEESFIEAPQKLPSHGPSSRRRQRRKNTL